MGVVVLLALVAAVAVLLARMRRERARRLARSATVSLVVDDWGVKRTLADGRHEEVGWDELQTVEAVTLPRGPWDDRVRFVLDGGGLRGCLVSRIAAEQAGLLEALGRLPGLDIQALGEVLDGTGTGKRVLWRRAQPSGLPGLAPDPGSDLT
jgi:hypothetical protein